LSEVTPEAFFERAIEISQPTAYVDTLIPAHSHYAEYLRSRGDDEGFRRHLKTAFETAVEAKWDRFVKQTRKRYRDVLKEMGVDTEVETESIEGVEA
jgi:hypothetical protein